MFDENNSALNNRTVLAGAAAEPTQEQRAETAKFYRDHVRSQIVNTAYLYDKTDGVTTATITMKSGQQVSGASKVESGQTYNQAAQEKAALAEAERLLWGEV